MNYGNMFPSYTHIHKSLSVKQYFDVIQIYFVIAAIKSINLNVRIQNFVLNTVILHRKVQIVEFIIAFLNYQIRLLYRMHASIYKGKTRPTK